MVENNLENNLDTKINLQNNLLNLKQFIEIFVNFREKTIIKRTLFDLKKAKDRSHILIGLFISIENIDEVISIIRQSKTPNDAKSSLLKKKWNFKIW